jgi:hypothetical protein
VDGEGNAVQVFFEVIPRLIRFHGLLEDLVVVEVDCHGLPHPGEGVDAQLSRHHLERVAGLENQR